MGTLTASGLQPQNLGSIAMVQANIAFGTSYNNTGNDNTTGESLSAAVLGLSRIARVEFPSDEGGYAFQVLYSTSGAEVNQPTGVRVKVYQGASGTTGATSGGTPAGTNSTSSVTGTAAAQTFTGTAPLTNLDLATPAFSGTGLTAAGQVITTTDNQTMTLDQCAGMWLLSATGATPPNLILSNTAVSGAPAVLTVQGAANTDAGAYKIVKHAAPVGTNAASASLTATAAAQTFTGSALSTHTHSVGAAAGGEVPNATNLSTALATVPIIVYGF